MWVNSKTAAAVFCVNHKSVEKSAFRATKQGKNFCSLKSHICNFMYSNGIGRGGKVLQIWIDDEIIAEFESKNGVRVSQNGIIQGGVAVMDGGVSANLHSRNATTLNNTISHGVGGANIGGCVVVGNLGFGDCHEVAVATSRNDNGSCVGSANLQGRGGDFANLHNENLGGSVVSAGSVEVATGGDRNEVSKIEPFVHVKKFLDTSATSEAFGVADVSLKTSEAVANEVRQVSCERSEAEQNKRSAFSQSEKCFLENKRSGDTHEVRGGFLAEQSEAEQSQNGVRVSINGISHGVGGANLDNGSLNTGDCFETHGVSRNDNRDGSVGGRGVGVSGSVGGRGVAGNGEVVGNSLDCFEPVGSRNDNKSVSGGVENSKKKSKKIKITELENMQKIKAVNELRNYPRGFSKTLWGQNIAKKYGVSLKTLYAWAKVIESEEYERMHETSGVYGSGVGLVAHNSKNAVRDSSKNIGTGELGSGKINGFCPSVVEIEEYESLIYGENKRSGGERSETGFCENKRSGGERSETGFLRAERSRAKQHARNARYDYPKARRFSL